MVFKSNSDFLVKFPVNPSCLNDISALRQRLESDLACQICYKLHCKDSRRRRGKNKSKELPKFIPISETSTSLQKHIFAIALSRTDIFDNESPQNHRFSDKSGFRICKMCFMTCWNHFRNVDFSVETTDFYNFVCPASSTVQVGSSQNRLNVGPSEDNSNMGPSQDHEDISVERLSQEIANLSPNAQGSHEPDSIEDPDSDIEFEYNPPPAVENEDEIPVEDNSSSSQSSSSDSQPALRSLTYFKTKNKYISIIDCSQISIEKCIICGNSPSAIEEAILLNTELVYDFIDFFKIGLKNWNETQFVCDTCHPSSCTISDASLELVKAKNPPKKFNKFVVKKNMSERDIITFHEQRSYHEGLIAGRSERSDRLSLKSLSDNDCLDLYFHNKNQIKFLAHCCSQAGMRKIGGFSASEQLLIFLFISVNDLSYRKTGTIFKSNKSTIERVFHNVLQHLKDFSLENSSMRSPDQVLLESTTGMCKRVYGNAVVLLIDCTYHFLHKPSNDMDLNQKYYCPYKHRHLVKTQSIVTTAGQPVASSQFFPGRESDNSILSRTFEREFDCFDGFMEIIDHAEDVVLILDRGYANFKKSFEQKQAADPAYYPHVKIRIPVDVIDPVTKQYPTRVADESRLEITSLRWAVEVFHRRIKTFGICSNIHQLDFVLANFNEIYRFLTASITLFGYSRRCNTQSTLFNATEKFMLLANNPYLFNCTIKDQVHNSDSVIHPRKRRHFTEVSYKDANLILKFQHLTSDMILKLSGGRFLFEKSKSYDNVLRQALDIRARERFQNLGDHSTITRTSRYNQMNKLEVLDEVTLQAHFEDVNFLLRVNIPSFHTSQGRMLTYIALNRDDRFHFYCSCPSGMRSMPCAHSLAFIRLIFSLQ